MTATTAIQNGFGKLPQKAVGERFTQIGETNSRVINAIKEMYENPAVIFGRWIGVTDKTAKRKLNLERSLSVEELGVLIRSERGFEIVAAIVGDATPKWWRLMRPLMDAAEAREMQIAARRRLKQTIESALDADQHLTAAIQRAEALSDQDHASTYLDALRSQGRVPGRTVAARPKRYLTVRPHHGSGQVRGSRMSLVQQLHAEHKARLAKIASSAVDGPQITQLKRALSDSQDRISELNDELRRQRQIIAAQKTYIEKLAGVASTAQPKLEEILNAVCKRFGVSREVMRSQSRDSGNTKCRQIYYFLGLEYEHAFAAIGFYISEDHATVLYGERKIRKDIQTDTQLRFDIEELKKAIAVKVYERQQSLQKYLEEGE